MMPNPIVRVKIASGDKRVALNVARRDLSWKKLSECSAAFLDLAPHEEMKLYYRHWDQTIEKLVDHTGLVSLLSTIEAREGTIYLYLHPSEVAEWVFVPTSDERELGYSEHTIAVELVDLLHRVSRTLHRFRYNPEVIKTISHMASTMTVTNTADQIPAMNNWLDMIGTMPRHGACYPYLHEEEAHRLQRSSSHDTELTHYQTPAVEPPSYDYHSIGRQSSSSWHPGEKEPYHQPIDRHDPTYVNLTYSPVRPGASYYYPPPPPPPPPPSGRRSVYERLRHRGPWMPRHSMYMGPPPPPPPMPVVLSSPPPPTCIPPPMPHDIYHGVESYKLLKSIHRQMKKESKRERRQERRQEKKLQRQSKNCSSRGKQPAMIMDGYQSSSSLSSASSASSSSYISAGYRGESSKLSQAPLRKSRSEHISADDEDDLSHEIVNLSLDDVYFEPKQRS